MAEFTVPRDQCLGFDSQALARSTHKQTLQNKCTFGSLCNNESHLGGLRADVLSAEKMSSPETQNWSSNICISIPNKLVLQVDSEGHHSFFLSLLSRWRLKRFGCLSVVSTVFKIRPCVSAAAVRSIQDTQFYC